MAKQRGFFAELQRQAEAAARQQAQAARQAEKARSAAEREAERARKANERAVLQNARADAAEQKRLDKEAQIAHQAEMAAQVETLNAELSQTYDAIDSMLAATLDVDDYVDLATLRTEAQHPPFDRADLEVPVPTPAPMPDPPEVVWAPPLEPTGLQGLFGKKKYEQDLAEATAAYHQAVAQRQIDLAHAEATRQAAAAQHAEAEAARLAALEVERARYASECANREEQAAEQNRALETLASNLAYGSADAVEEYLSLVFSHSTYPVDFPVEHDFEFDAATAELRLKVCVPGPAEVPTISAYKYTNSSDEITSTPLSQKAGKDRYAGAVLQVALRSLHEVFEADRRGLIKTISLEVGAQAIDPATGLERYIPFVAVGAERDSFTQMDLSNVIPSATLAHLGAAISKNPYELLAADTSGIRHA